MNDYPSFEAIMARVRWQDQLDITMSPAFKHYETPTDDYFCEMINKLLTPPTKILS